MGAQPQASHIATIAVEGGILEKLDASKAPSLDMHSVSSNSTKSLENLLDIFVVRICVLSLVNEKELDVVVEHAPTVPLMAPQTAVNIDIAHVSPALVVDQIPTANFEKGETSKAAFQKIVTWSNKLKHNLPSNVPNFKHKAEFFMNPDGSMNLIPPKEFLLQARKQ